MNLDKIALKHGTDKASSHHGYTRQYERYFADLPKIQPRNFPVLLELGWGGHEDPDAGGNSARMWREWLQNFTIITIDNEPKNVPNDDPWFVFRQGDQTDATFLSSIAAEYGVAGEEGSFDVIIDDASHLSSLTIKSFELLWPHLKPGGWYVVEDTHMAYHDFYYGEEEADADPSTHVAREADLIELGGQTVTAMGFLKRLADEVNFANSGEDWDLFPKEHWLGYEVEEIHFHFNIVFVKKRG